MGGNALLATLASPQLAFARLGLARPAAAAPLLPDNLSFNRRRTELIVIFHRSFIIHGALFYRPG